LSAEVLVEPLGRSRSTDVSSATVFILATTLDLAADPDECEFAQAFSGVGSLNTPEERYGENISLLPAEGGSPYELGSSGFSRGLLLTSKLK
jgi:hypothetical protein